MIIQIIDATIYVLTLAIFARAILSWFIHDLHNPVMEFLYTVTEPILAPIRRFMPAMGIDLSPMVAIILLAYVVPAIINQIV